MWDLFAQAAQRFPSADVILERDDSLPPWADLVAELDEARARHAAALAAPRRRTTARRGGARSVPRSEGSVPRKRLVRDSGEWNHYYIRAINGEIRLWVNGEEVSGGNSAEPRTGYLCLESEGAPVEFRNIRLRELP